MSIIPTLPEVVTIGLLVVLLIRSYNMPTKQEVKDAVQAAVGEEAAQVATRLKALEDRIAELEVGQAFTEEDKAELVAMVQGIFTPA